MDFIEKLARSPLPRLAGGGEGGGGAPAPVLHDCIGSNIGSNFPLKLLGQGSYRPSYAAAPVVRN